MLGDDLLGIPVITEGDNVTNTTMIHQYFPVGSEWFDFHSGDYIPVEQSGKVVSLVVPFDSLMPLY